MASLTTNTLDQANPSGVTGTGRLDNSLREALANKISNISRQDTPFTSSIGTEKTGRETFDWLTDADENPVFNANAQGAAFSEPSVNGRTRLYNYTQIYLKNIHVADTTQAADTAGISSEYKYQMMKRARELKKDVEAQNVRFGAAGANLTRSVKRPFDGTNAATSASVWTWVSNQETREANTVTEVADDNFDGTPNTVTAGVAAGLSFNTRANGTSLVVDSNGTPEALSRAKVNSILTKIYNAGQGNPTMAMMSPALKVQFSDVYANADVVGNDIRRITAVEKMIGTAITKITTDFGFMIGAMPNWIMTDTHGSSANNILFYEPALFKSCVLCPYSEKPPDHVCCRQPDLAAFLSTDAIRKT